MERLRRPRRLSEQVFLLSELLVRDGALDHLPPLSGRALFHAHCHQKALIPRDGVKEVLEKLGLEVEFPDSGCCGMAGSFGFEAGEHYESSAACGERVLLPAVRAAAPDTLLLADGFSCREQIAQGTGRSALHLAQVLRMACEGAKPSLASRWKAGSGGTRPSPGPPWPPLEPRGFSPDGWRARLSGGESPGCRALRSTWNAVARQVSAGSSLYMRVTFHSSPGSGRYWGMRGSV